MTTHRPLFWVAVSFGLGILAHNVGATGQSPLLFGRSPVHFSFNVIVLVTFIFLSGSLLLRKKKLAIVFVLFSFICLGFLFSKGYQYFPKSHISHVAKYYRKKPVQIEGIILSDIEKRDFFNGKKSSFILKTNRLKTKWGWRKKTGKILIHVFRDVKLNYGDYVFLEGKLHQPFNFSSDNTFSYREYLRRKGIKLILSIKKNIPIQVLKTNRGNLIKAGSLRFKSKLKKIFSQYLTENETALMHAVILGDRYNIPNHIKKLFIHTGTAHILAISGLHVGIVAFVFFILLKILPIGRRCQHVLTIILLVFYAFLTGGRPSVVRATIMAVVFISSFIVERETDAINSLSLSAIILLMVNPLNILDVGFQLSFISVLSIICFFPLIAECVPKSINRSSKKFLLFFRPILVSLSVWVGITGLIIYYFQIITPITVLANLLVIPMIAIVIMLGFGILFFSGIWSGFGFIFASCIKVVLNIMVAAVYLLSQFPWAYIYTGKIDLRWIILYYVVLAIIFSGASINRSRLIKNKDLLI